MSERSDKDYRPAKTLIGILLGSTVAAAVMLRVLPRDFAVVVMPWIVIVGGLMGGAVGDGLETLRTANPVYRKTTSHKP